MALKPNIDPFQYAERLPITCSHRRSPKEGSKTSSNGAKNAARARDTKITLLRELGNELVRDATKKRSRKSDAQANQSIMTGVQIQNVDH
jgi:hypothetical protein